MSGASTIIVPDDTTSILDALKEYPARVVLRAGKYDAPHSISGRVTICGCDPRSEVVLRGMIGFGGVCEGTVLENLTIVSQSGCAVDIGSDVKGCPTLRYCDLSCESNDAAWVHSDAVFHHCVIHNCADCGINSHPFDPAVKITIEGCEFSECGTAVALCRSVGSGCNVVLSGNHIHHCRLPLNVGNESVTGVIERNLFIDNQQNANIQDFGGSASDNDEHQQFDGVGESPELQKIFLTTSISTDADKDCPEVVFTAVSGNTVARFPLSTAQLDLHKELQQASGLPLERLVIVSPGSRVLSRGARAPQSIIDFFS